MLTSTVGKYLATRFEQIGLKHYFMVPGDYNLVLLDELLSNKNVEQIGCCNELNAAYAAEGYARINGCGAVVTTFNVGAFSALNGIAGAYAERLPVIFVSAGYNSNDPSKNHLLHHTIATHDLAYQYEMFEKVTCAAVRILHPDDAPSLIDHAIGTALRERKPAYIEIACNLSNALCPEPAQLKVLGASEGSDPSALDEAVMHARTLLANAERPVLLAGPHLRPFGAVEGFRQLAEALGCAVAVMPAAKGFFPEEHRQYIGVYLGDVSSPGCQGIMDWADLVMACGPVFNDYTTVGWTALPDRERLINVEPRSVIFPDSECTNVMMADLLSAIAKSVAKNDTSLVEHQRTNRGSKTAVQPDMDTAPLTRAEMCRQIEGDIDAKTTLLVETGDSWFNGIYRRLPDGARFEIEMQWGSIGWAVPATFGYGMGLEPERRLVSVIGDGSFQLTAQEVANMIRYGQETLIFLVNNRGYVIESEIHEGPYNYFKNWDYAGLLSVFNAEEGRGLGLMATTAGELTTAIKKARAHTGGPVLIECQIAHDDCTPQLLAWGKQVALANGRPPRES
jgi:pyruvate decarboxylase